MSYRRVICAGLSVALAYIAYEPLPSDVDDWLILTVLMAFRNWGVHMVKAVTLFDNRDADLRMNRLFFPPRYHRNLTTPYSYGDVKVHETEFSGVTVRIYEHIDIKDKKQRAAVIYFHGGGWYLGSVDTFDHLLVYFAYELQMVIIAVEYRLAPENAYPTPLQDCLHATRHVFEHAQQLRIDAGRVAVFGDSSGGHIATTVSLKLRDLNLPYRPKLQILINPMLQGVTFTLPSFRRDFTLLVGDIGMAKCYIFSYGKFNGSTKLDETAEKMVLNQHLSPATKEMVNNLVNMLPAEYRKDYAPSIDHGTEEGLRSDMEPFVLDPYVSPLFATSLTDLPETYIWVAGYDILRDEGVLYAKRLEQAGNKVTSVINPTSYHAGWAVPTPTGNKHKLHTFKFIKEKL